MQETLCNSLTSNKRTVERLRISSTSASCATEGLRLLGIVARIVRSWRLISSTIVCSNVRLINSILPTSSTTITGSGSGAGTTSKSPTKTTHHQHSKNYCHHHHHFACSYVHKRILSLFYSRHAHRVENKGG